MSKINCSGHDHTNCENFLDLKRAMNTRPMTSLIVANVTDAIEICRILCNGVKSECLAATDSAPVSEKEADGDSAPASSVRSIL